MRTWECTTVARRRNVNSCTTHSQATGNSDKSTFLLCIWRHPRRHILNPWFVMSVHSSSLHHTLRLLLPITISHFLRHSTMVMRLRHPLVLSLPQNNTLRAASGLGRLPTTTLPLDRVAINSKDFEIHTTKPQSRYNLHACRPRQPITINPDRDKAPKKPLTESASPASTLDLTLTNHTL